MSMEAVSNVPEWKRTPIFKTEGSGWWERIEATFKMPRRTKDHETEATWPRGVKRLE